MQLHTDYHATEPHVKTTQTVLPKTTLVHNQCCKKNVSCPWKYEWLNYKNVYLYTYINQYIPFTQNIHKCI